MQPKRCPLFVVVVVSLIWHLQSGLALSIPKLESGADNGVSSPVENQQSRSLLENVYVDCSDVPNSVSCVKLKLFSVVDRVLAMDELSLGSGIRVVRTAPAPAPAAGVGDSATAAPRSISGDAELEKDTTAMVMDRVNEFLSTHTLKFDLKGTDVLNLVNRAGKAIENMSKEEEHELSEDEDETVEGRGKKKGGGGGKKKGKMIGHLLMLLKLKLVALIPLLFVKLAVIAGKALILAKIALVISLIILLKKLLASHHKTVSYEVVGHHVGGHDDSYSGGGGGVSVAGGDYSGGGGGYHSDGGSGHGHDSWGRSSDAHSMAYSAYKPSNGKVN